MTANITKDMLEKMTEFEGALAQHPNAIHHSQQDFATHEFGDGLYIRTFTSPKGFLCVSKLHKTTHPYFIMSGDVSVLTPEGFVRIKTPYHGMTKAGTKRILFFHEKTVWITVHATKETDLDLIEKEVIAEKYEYLPLEIRKEIELHKGVSLCRG